MKNALGICIGGLAATLSITASTATAEPAALTSSDGWRYDLTAYAFLPTSTTGIATIAGTPAELDLDLKDALDLLDFAISGRFEAWKGDWGFVADANYMALSVHAAPGPVLDVEVEQAWLGLLAAYRVSQGTYGSQNRNYSVDLQAGARYNSLKQEIVVTTPVAATLGGTETWWEPVIAARGIWELSEDWTGVLMADAGGFGVNGSNLQWSTTLGFDYSRWENTSIKFGWRYYSIDFETVRSDGVFAYDVSQSGPFIGLTYTFN